MQNDSTGATSVTDSREAAGPYPADAPAAGVTGRSTWFNLFLISFVALFFEVLIIRWMAEEVRIFSYFKNMTLIACFLGLGLGSILARKKFDMYRFFMPLLAMLFVCVKIASLAGARITYPGGDEHYIWGVLAKPGFISQITSYYNVVIFFFLLCAAVFVPLGQKLGQLIRTHPPIKAYTINILGSLVGVWAFTALCFAGLEPTFWFAAGIACFLWLLRRRTWLVVAVVIGAGIIVFLAVSAASSDTVWSPYYRIDITEDTDADTGETLQTTLRVNRDYHQRMVNLSPAFVAAHPDFYEKTKPDISYHVYNLPYMYYKPRNVLVVGAGSGNDVAAALRNGAGHVDAVEIDSTIMQLGRDLHPEQPYSSSRVTPIVNDARTYFKQCDKKYDMIVFGLLDSHTVISSMSSLRLDNYVYTLESFKEVKRLLEKDGVVAFSFSVGRRRAWIGHRLYAMLSQTFETEPLYLATHYDGGILFVIGPDALMQKYRENAEIEKRTQAASERVKGFTTAAIVPMTTDDWPNLYLKFKKIPAPYLFTLAILLVLSAMAVLKFMPRGAKVNLHFLFLGVAFLLIEVKSINELALIFGSTWLVTGIVISAILITILFANLFVSRTRERPLWVYYSFLLASIVLGFFLPAGAFLDMPALPRMVGPCAIASLPIFFAGIIFATSFKKSKQTEVAFGSNLLGAMGGGMLEYSSLIIGIRSLFMIAGGAYLLSFIARIFRR